LVHGFLVYPFTAKWGEELSSYLNRITKSEAISFDSAPNKVQKWVIRRTGAKTQE
jgi:hypothetical protein